MSGQRVGYVRVSTLDQVTDRQLDGVQLDRTFTDKASGKDVARPQLKAMLAFVRDGDTVVAHSMDRLARNLDDLRALVRTLTGRGVRVEFVKEQLTFTGEDSPMANLLLSVMGAFAEFERALIRERQREGIALAKARGAYRGRRPTLSPEQAKQLRARVAAGESKAAVARDYRISRQTVYQYLQPPSVPADGEAELTAVLATLPPDRRPLPSVAAYDELLPSRTAADATDHPPATADAAVLATASPTRAATKTPPTRARVRKAKRPWLAVEHDPADAAESSKVIVIASFTTRSAGLTYLSRQRGRQHDPDIAYSLINEGPDGTRQAATADRPAIAKPPKPGTRRAAGKAPA